MLQWTTEWVFGERFTETAHLYNFCKIHPKFHINLSTADLFYTYLTEFFSCFDRLFKFVNAQSHKFQQKRRSIRLISDEDLVGIEYLWKLILSDSDEVADRGVQLIREIYTNISPQLKSDIKRIHQTFIQECFQRFKLVYDQIKSKPNPATYQQRLNVLIRILVVLREYLAECDYSYHKERGILPMSR